MAWACHMAPTVKPISTHTTTTLAHLIDLTTSPRAQRSPPLPPATTPMLPVCPSPTPILPNNVSCARALRFIVWHAPLGTSSQRGNGFSGIVKVLHCPTQSCFGFAHQMLGYLSHDFQPCVQKVAVYDCSVINPASKRKLGFSQSVCIF